MPVPFAPKLRLAPLWPAVAALLLVAGLALLLVPGRLAASAAEELDSTLRMLSPALPIPARGQARPDAAIQDRVVELAASTPYRITIIAIDGTVVADSDRSLEQVREMDNHLSRPEISDALARGSGRSVRHSDTLDVDLAYATRLLTAPSGDRAIARLALPLSALSSLRRQLRAVLLLSALAAAVVAVLLGWWLQRSLFRPLSLLIGSAQRMGEGELRVPIEIPQERELSVLARSLQRLGERLEAQLQALAAERDHLSSTVASMNEGVLVTDAGGRPQRVNPAFRRLFGLSAEVEPGSVLDLAREARIGDLVARALSALEAVSTEIERLEPEPRTLALLATPLSSGEGAVVVARDVTEAERLSRMRKDFVANVSHELRTPLAAIRGYAETLVDGAAGERDTAQRFSERILEQCRRLGDLLDDLLTLSRLEGTEPFREVEPVDLRGLAAEAADVLAGAAAAREVAIEVEPGGTVEVEGDPDGLLRLLSNLLDNAIKYNRRGGRVAVSFRSSEEWIAIEVADTGIGIATAHQSRIFERFYRVDRGRARDEGGTGLGLAIVKHVAQAHGGRVEVESEPGSGSTFRVLLPPGR